LFGINRDNLKQLKVKVDGFFNDFKHKATVSPLRIEIPSNHILETNNKTFKLEPVASTPFEEEKDYFKVIVNQIYLKNQSELWVSTSPTVIASTQFGYADKIDVSVPCLVGPAAIQKKISDVTVPAGGKMLIEDTPVAGYYPYKGGDLRSTILLCQLNNSDFAKKLMNIIENIAGAINYSIELSPYMKIADALMDGIVELKGLKDGLSPVIGYDAPFKKPCSIALINKEKIEDELWVIDGKLKKGSTAEEACKETSKFIEADYTLISISKTQTRNDIRFLPFYSSYPKIVEDACKKDKASWLRATTDLSTLFMTMYTSPDLTQLQAQTLYDKWLQEITDLHKKHAINKGEIDQPSVNLEDVDITEEEKDIIKAKLRTEPTPKEKQLLQQSLKALTLNRS
jgi:hypothetical protein